MVHNVNCSFIVLASASGLKDNSQSIISSDGKDLTATTSDTALLLISDSPSGLNHHISTFSIHLLIKLLYANSLGYDVLLYTHNQELPPGVPAYFIKSVGAKLAMFTLGYRFVLGHDWNTYMSPFTAVPLSGFFSEWPSASIILQDEPNLCAGVILYCKTSFVFAFLLCLLLKDTAN